MAKISSSASSPASLFEMDQHKSQHVSYLTIFLLVCCLLCPHPPAFSFYNDDGDDQINHKSSRDAGGKIQKLRYCISPLSDYRRENLGK